MLQTHKIKAGLNVQPSCLRANLAAPANISLSLCRSAIMLGDPLRNRLLQCRALALQLAECFPAHMCDVWLLSFSAAVVTRNINRLPEVESGAFFSP
jgi:hypothetical protein